jgi:hypothetical protein
MTKYVRVKDKDSGNHFTLPENSNLLLMNKDRFEVTNLPALDKSGRPRPPKYPAKKPAAEQATEASTTEAQKEATKS